MFELDIDLMHSHLSIKDGDLINKVINPVIVF